MFTFVVKVTRALYFLLVNGRPPSCCSRDNGDDSLAVTVVVAVAIVGVVVVLVVVALVVVAEVVIIGVIVVAVVVIIISSD